MDSIYQHISSSRRLIISSYWVFTLGVIAVVGYVATTYLFDSGLEWPADYLPGLVWFVALSFIYWCTLYGTGSLSGDGYWHSKGQRIVSGLMGRWPRLVAIGRWLLAIPALALEVSVQLTVIAMCYLVLAARIGDNVVSERNLTEGFLGELIPVIAIFSVTFVLALIFFIVLAWRTKRLYVLFYSHAIIAILSFYGLMVLAVTLHLQLAVFKGGDNELISMLFIPSVQLTMSLGALLRLCFGKTVHRVCSPNSDSLPKPISNFSGSSCLSSARIFATALLVVSYIAIDVSIELANDMGKLQEARSMLAAMASAELKTLDPDTKEMERTPVGHLSRAQQASRSQGFLGTSRPEIIRLDSYDGRTWLARPMSVRVESSIPAEVALVEVKKVLTQRLIILAQQLDLKDKEQEDFYAFFYRVERQLTDVKQVSIPVIGVEVEAGRAAWVLMIVTLLILILIRSRVRRVFTDENYAREEPWLILDGGSKLERIAAYTWLILLATATWITHLGLLMALGAIIPAEGGVTTIYGDLLRFASALTIFILATWVAHDTVRHLLTLRRLRGETISTSKRQENAVD